MRFSSVLIGSDNPERLSAYYSKLFGEAMIDGGYATWMLGDGGISVGPHSEVHGPNAQPGRIILNIESEDVKADFAKFKAAGASVVREPYNFDEFPDYWVATLSDPDGNYFQLVSPMTPGGQSGDAG